MPPRATPHRPGATRPRGPRSVCWAEMPDRSTEDWMPWPQDPVRTDELRWESCRCAGGVMMDYFDWPESPNCARGRATSLAWGTAPPKAVLLSGPEMTAY